MVLNHFFIFMDEVYTFCFAELLVVEFFDLLKPAFHCRARYQSVVFCVVYNHAKPFSVDSMKAVKEHHCDVEFIFSPAKVFNGFHKA